MLKRYAMNASKYSESSQTDDVLERIDPTEPTALIWGRIARLEETGIVPIVKLAMRKTSQANNVIRAEGANCIAYAIVQASKQ